jgi:hypothetical protein
MIYPIEFYHKTSSVKSLPAMSFGVTMMHHAHPGSSLSPASFFGPPGQYFLKMTAELASVKQKNVCCLVSLLWGTMAFIQQQPMRSRDTETKRRHCRPFIFNQR